MLLSYIAIKISSLESLLQNMGTLKQKHVLKSVGTHIDCILVVGHILKIM